jgi:RNA recognition motif-containing protein
VRSTALAHSRVPKPKNLKELYGVNANAQGFTTIMVRNLPNRYKQRDFVEELTLLGLPAGTWDFLYVPVDTHTNSSVGYAFVNFVSTEIAQHAMQVFDQYRWRRFRKQTSKPAAVNKAHIQGLANNLDHFSRTAIKDAKVKQHRPLVLAGAHELPSWAASVDNEWNPEQCYFVGIAAF